MTELATEPRPEIRIVEHALDLDNLNALWLNGHGGIACTGPAAAFCQLAHDDCPGYQAPLFIWSGASMLIDGATWTVLARDGDLIRLGRQVGGRHG